MYKTVHGLVLREVKFKEADKMLTVLTQEEGKISVRARGALRKSCRFAAASQQFAYSEMTLFLNRGRYYLEEASVVEDFRGLRERFEELALAAYFAELLEAVSDEDSPDPELLRLGLNALFALSRDLYPAKQVKAAFELRCACIAGYAPDLVGCHACGNQNPDLFDISQGHLECGKCRSSESDGIRMPITRGVQDAMQYIAYCDPKRILQFRTSPETMELLSGITEAYLTTQLERGFSTLDFYKSLLI